MACMRENREFRAVGSPVNRRLTRMHFRLTGSGKEFWLGDLLCREELMTAPPHRIARSPARRRDASRSHNLRQRPRRAPRQGASSFNSVRARPLPTPRVPTRPG